MTILWPVCAREPESKQIFQKQKMLPHKVLEWHSRRHLFLSKNAIMVLVVFKTNFEFRQKRIGTKIISSEYFWRRFPKFGISNWKSGRFRWPYDPTDKSKNRSETKFWLPKSKPYDLQNSISTPKSNSAPKNIPESFLNDPKSYIFSKIITVFSVDGFIILLWESASAVLGRDRRPGATCDRASRTC